jgi:hypothetical protein
MIFLGIFLNAFRDPDELANRLQFVVGGVLGIAFLAGFDYFAADPLREYFQGGYLICTSMCSP